jgi:hypothetical protein
MLMRATKHRGSADRRHILYQSSASHLYKMWFMLKHIRPRSLVICAANIIQRGFKRLNIDPRPNSVISIPFRNDIRIGGLRDLPKKIVSRLRICKEQKKLINSEIRHVFTRRRNVADALLNTRALAKSFSKKEPCTCNEVKRILKLDDQWTTDDNRTIRLDECLVNDHLVIRALDLPKHTHDLMRVNLKHIPEPTLPTLRCEVMTSVDEWIKNVEPCIALGSKHIIIKGDFVSFKENDKCIANIQRERFDRWFQEYETIRKTHPKLFKKYGGTRFFKDVTKMIRLHTREIDFDHWANDQLIYQRLCKIMGTDTEYFASPLNFNLACKNFFSEHDIDRLFGSKGNSWKAKWHQPGLVNPIYKYKYLKRTFARAIHAAQRHKQGYLLTVPIWEHSVDIFHHYLRHDMCTLISLFEKDTYGFHHPNTAVFQNPKSGYKNVKTHKRTPAPWRVAIIWISETKPIPQQIDAINLMWHETSLQPMSDVLTKNFVGSQPPFEERNYRKDLGGHTRRKWKDTKRLVSVYPSLSYAGISLGMDMEKEIDEVISKIAMVPTRCEKTSIGDFYTLAKELRDNALVTEIDKNACTSIVACKKYEEYMLDKTFLKDDHYLHLDEDAIAIRANWKHIFESKKWGAFGGFNEVSRQILPYGYAIPKNKDIAKTRPIVSYCVHPMGPMLRRASRAIKFMLEYIDEPHWTLWRVDQFIPTLKTLFDELTNDDPDLGVIALAGDIKQMYTELDHNTIMEALKWLTETYKKKSRRTQVAVPKNTNKGTHRGTSYERSFVNFNIDDIVDIVKFDLENAIFTVGDTILKQKIGIPMGSPISPILAILVCAYSENVFTNNNKYEDRRVLGTRYVDDAKFLTVYRKSDENDFVKACETLRNVSKTCYHKNLEVECDPDQTNIKMLESIVHWPESGNMFTAEFWHKNKDSISTRGRQTFVKFQRADSFSPSTSKKGVLISTFMRIRNASSDEQEFLKALPAIFKELRILQYSLSTVNRVIDRMKADPEPKGWGSMRNTWETAHKLACDEWR